MIIDITTDIGEHTLYNPIVSACILRTQLIFAYIKNKLITQTKSSNINVKQTDKKTTSKSPKYLKVFFSPRIGTYCFLYDFKT